MNAGDALELYEALFCIAMMLGLAWLCTGQYALCRRGRVRCWVYTLNRISFWGWTIALLASLFFAFRLL